MGLRNRVATSLRPWERKEKEISVEILDILPAEKGMENGDTLHELNQDQTTYKIIASVCIFSFLHDRR